nr:GH32 C-terminal domain-containing protein [Faecalibacterium sp. An122]
MLSAGKPDDAGYAKKWNGEGYDEKHLSLARLDALRIYLDQSTAELFVNHGETTFTCKAYFGADTRIHIVSQENIRVSTWPPLRHRMETQPSAWCGCLPMCSCPSSRLWWPPACS